MIQTKELDGARWQYRQSAVTLDSAKGKLSYTLDHLKHMKKLLALGVIKHSAYQSYKATTAQHRALLVEAVASARLDMHNKYRAYDELQKQYNKQNPQTTLLNDTLAKLSDAQKEMLEEYFKNL